MSDTNSNLIQTSLYVDERTCSSMRIKVFPDCYVCGPETALLQLAEIVCRAPARQPSISDK